MIPKAYIDHWRKIAPWQDDAQIEQDLVLSRALIDIFSVPRLSQSLRFRGGTALYKLFFSKKVRYSEDIDLVQAEAGAIGQDIDILRAVLDPWLGEPKRKRGTGIFTLIYRFTSEIEKRPLRLKVEINTREHTQCFPLIYKQFDVESEWFSGSARIMTYTLEELMGSKLKALFARKKGRDLFDCWMALSEDNVDLTELLQAFQHYMKLSEQTVSRAEFEQNIFYKLKDEAFRADMTPLLVAKSGWNIDEAARVVSEQLIANIPGDPWRGEG
ncbi:nucleotidyl transferase AbiEii/AbiGii toxin family protein [bacterium]|nr:nucleotidyl transferase AbiEii/AbiGii toxin family protein [bacterium]